jgi:hypothetical protein
VATATFSPCAAILSGFRLVSGRPVAALSWALMVAVGGTIMAGLQVWAWQALDGGRGLAVVAVRLGLSGAVLGGVMTVVACAAVLRATVRPDERHAAWPRFGGDELRLLAFVLPLALVLGMISAAISALSYPLLAEHAARPVVLAYAMRLTAMAMTLLSARLALAAPMTVADRRLRLAGALTLSQGRHLRLAAVFVAALLISMTMEWVGTWARDALTGAMGITSPPVLKSSSLSAALSAAFGPAAMIYRGVGAVIHVLAIAVQVAPMGYIYRRLKNGSVGQVAVFD